MEVTFWGVRGSIPSPGPATVRYGGNTSCVSVRLDDGEIIMIDCGTGARNFGISLLAGVFGKGSGSATVLLSHAHWDHTDRRYFKALAPEVTVLVPSRTSMLMRLNGVKSPTPVHPWQSVRVADAVVTAVPAAHFARSNCVLKPGRP